MMKMYQCLYIDAKVKPKDVWKYIEEVMKYRGEQELLKEWSNWDPPKFPVGGKDLKDSGCPPGKMYSVLLDKLKDRWKESEFTMTKDKLMMLLPEVMDEISIEKKNKVKKRSPSPFST